MRDRTNTKRNSRHGDSPFVLKTDHIALNNSRPSKRARSDRSKAQKDSLRTSAKKLEGSWAFVFVHYIYLNFGRQYSAVDFNENSGDHNLFDFGQ